MSKIRFYQPKELVFGDHCFDDFTERLLKHNCKDLLIIVDPFIEAMLSEFLAKLKKHNKNYRLISGISGEPTRELFNKLKAEAEEQSVDAVIGVGGGSVLDMAKLIAALSFSEQDIDSVFGIDQVRDRKLMLACIPTTAGTGSEVSPNAILLDEKENLKKGVVSKFLVPDMAFVDPVMTYSVPPAVTASTGIDALTHCIEGYANKFAHPVTDMYALEGIRLITRSLENACFSGQNAEARADVALGSLYGGLCLGPVNTGAVHALSYPLGGEYHIPHGIANAILLPHVMRLNLPEATARYASIGSAMGIDVQGREDELAKQAIDSISQLCQRIGIPPSLGEFHVTRDDVPRMTKAALSVKRLLKNNLRELTEKEVAGVYYQLVS
jgi:alcohol dehydrogenase class IV